MVRGNIDVLSNKQIYLRLLLGGRNLKNRAASFTLGQKKGVVTIIVTFYTDEIYVYIKSIKPHSLDEEKEKSVIVFAVSGLASCT